jgi:hypothetical protein
MLLFIGLTYGRNSRKVRKKYKKYSKKKKIQIVCNFFFKERRSHCAAQAGVKLKIFLPQPSKHWDHRCVPPGLT